MTNDILLSQIENELERYRQLYDALRIIDPVNKRTIGRSDNSYYGLGNISYGYWTDDLISDDSIAVRAFKEKSCVMKLEHVADSTCLVTAFPIEISNGKLVLELLKKVTDSLSIGSNNYYDPSDNLALKDELTNLFNRRYVDERLSRDIAKAFVEQSPMSVIFLDVDNLKEINDSLGHAFGDKVLIGVSDIIIRSIRSDADWVARYGGDEFLICLNNTEPKVTFEIAERIRNKVTDLVILQNGTIKTTASLGIYSTGKHEVTAAEAISYADSKMYEAKRNGKNCANISKNKQVYTKAPSTLTGGIAGSARFVPQTNITIENCYNRSNVISDMLDFGYNKGPEYCTGVTAGGIIGAAGGIRVQYCYSSAADISAAATTDEDAYGGGIAGLIWGTMLSEDFYETNANVAVGISGAVDSSMAIVPQADLAGEAEGATAAQLQTKSFYGDSWRWYTSGGTEPAYYSSTDPWRFAAANSYPVLRGLPYTTPTPPSGGGSYTPNTYKITATANTGGTITPAGNTTITENGSIAFTIKPDKNYIIKDVLVDGNSIGAVTTYTFTSVKANHTIEAKFAHDCPSKPFTDVDITQWYHEAIDYVLLAGLFKGTSATTFEPNISMTRAMLVTVLHRLEGTPATDIGNSFSDVASGKWYTNAVVWANVKGIVKGYDSDTFGTNDFITREQLATILYRYAQYKGYDVSAGEDTNILSYEDAFNISEYAIPAIQWACGAGIMQGDGAKLDPQGNATRAQVAVMLMRFIQNVVN